MSVSKSGSFQVEHPCPQCGGPVILEETDRFLLCNYCRVRLYIIAKDFLRYYLPPKTSRLEETIFVPYWRFRGLFFSIRAFEIKSKVIDTSFLSGNHKFLPPTLGFRTQTLKMKFAAAKTKTSYLLPHSPFTDAVSIAEKMNYFFDGYRGRVFHKSFIGETVSMIYSPLYVRNKAVYDGVLDRPVANITSLREEQLKRVDAKRGWDVQFVSALCPDCGWDLTGERDSMVLFCRNCNTSWHAEKGKLKKTDVKVSPCRDRNAVYLPFWKMSVKVEGLRLKSYADLVSVANLPRVIRPEWRKNDLTFWSPAFKAHPRMYLRLCCQMTIKQPDGNYRETVPRSYVCPVTIDSGEAFESVKITLSNIVAPKMTFFPTLPDFSITPKKAVLVLVPFYIRGNELIQTEMKFSIQKKRISGLQGL